MHPFLLYTKTWFEKFSFTRYVLLEHRQSWLSITFCLLLLWVILSLSHPSSLYAIHLLRFVKSFPCFSSIHYVLCMLNYHKLSLYVLKISALSGHEHKFLWNSYCFSHALSIIFISRATSKIRYYIVVLQICLCF